MLVLDVCCAALREGAVDPLIIGEIGYATVVAGDDLATTSPNPNMLSELGVAVPERCASIVRTGERIAPADGVFAALCYPPSAH